MVHTFLVITFLVSFSWKNRRKLPLFVPVSAGCGLIFSFFLAMCFLTVSRHNYAGGEAFSLLHRLVDRDTEAKIGEYLIGELRHACRDSQCVGA